MSRQAIHQRLKFDACFPAPIAKINNERVAVFSLSDIEAWEKERPNYGYMQSQQEWLAMSAAERARKCLPGHHSDFESSKED